MGKCIYVAELGINGNGVLDTYFLLIDLAKKHGFDYVKFQKRDIDLCYTQKYLDSPRDSIWGTTQRDQKLGLELSLKDYEAIDKYCKEKNIKWFYSPWDIKSAEQMEQFNCDFVKIAHASINNKALYNYYKGKNKNIILSINPDVDITGCFFFSVEYILSCVSLYPSPVNYSGLENMKWLKENYSERIGFSNHSSNWIYPVIASFMGAEMIEVHITLDKNMYGSDQKASLDDSDLTQMMKHKRDYISDEMLKTYLEEENKVLTKLRQTW
jgi:N-acetylneuraminate synthase